MRRSRKPRPRSNEARADVAWHARSPLPRLFALGTIAAIILGHALPIPGGAAPRHRTAALPQRSSDAQIEGYVERASARIWYASLGSGPPVILLHGGLSSSLAWRGQVPALLEAGYRVVLVDSRGHGRSTLGRLPLSYHLMAGDVLAVMDQLQLRKASVVGWSDGAITALSLAMERGERLCKVFAFGANADKGGVRPDAWEAPVLGQIGPRLAREHAELSPRPGSFIALQQAVRSMQASQPDFDRAQLATIRGPAVMIAAGAQDEFITPEHPTYLAIAVPGARLHIFGGSGHFAPWEQPEAFNRAVMGFLGPAPGHCPGARLQPNDAGSGSRRSGPRPRSG